MDVLVAEQDDTINAIETSANQVQKDTEAGYVTCSFAESSSDRSRSLGQTEKAVVHARSARRKRWYCFFLFLLILLVAGLAIGLSVGLKH
jgi:syntaxin 1B/2/3